MVDCSGAFFCFKRRVASFFGVARAVVAASGPLGGGSSEFTRFAARRGSCCENGLEFGQIDDNRCLQLPFSGLRPILLRKENQRNPVNWGNRKLSLVILPPAIANSSNRSRKPPIIVDLPEFDPVFSTSRVEIRLPWRFWSGVVSHSDAAARFAGSTEARSGALRRIWASRPAGGDA